MREWTLCYRHPETGAPTLPNMKQAVAHASPAEELFFGGAVGGGKSDYLIVEGMKTCVTYPGVQVAFFRRQSTDIRRTILPRFFELVPPKFGKWNKQDGQYTFPNGSIFWFLHCEREADVFRHQGAQWAKLLVDEASHMTEYQISYLMTRVRRARTDVRKQIALGSNPGNVGHAWLKRRFVRPTGEALGDRPTPEPFEIWTPFAPKNRPRMRMMTRQFVPAYFEDNYILQATDPDYLEKQVLQMRGAVARQLADGDWDVNDDQMFAADWHEWYRITADDTELLAYPGLTVGQVLPWHVIPDRGWWPPPDARIWGSVDYGYGAPWAFHLHAGLPGGHIRTFYEMYRSGVRDSEQAKFIRRVIERLMASRGDGGIGMQKPDWIVYDPQMDSSRKENNISQSIAEVYQEHLGIPLQLQLMAGGGGPGARISRIQRVKDALAQAPDGFPYWTIAARCPELIRTLPDLPRDLRPGFEEFIDEKAEDHAYEGCGRFFQMRPVPPPAPKNDDLRDLDPMSRLNAELLAKKYAGQSVTKLSLKGLV